MVQKYPNYRKRKTDNSYHCRNPMYDSMFSNLAVDILKIVNRRLSTSTKISDKSRPTHGGALARQVVSYIMAVDYEIPLRSISTAVCRHRSSIKYSLGAIEDKRDEIHFDRILEEIEAECLEKYPRSSIPTEALGTLHTAQSWHENAYIGRFA